MSGTTSLDTCCSITLGQQQRVRVLTDGSIDFRKIELVIRKIFGDSLDDTQALGVCLERRRGRWPGRLRELLWNLLHFDSNTGEVYMIVDDLPPAFLEETEAIEYAGEYLSWVFFETRDRIKGKGKGKSGKRGKSKSFGKGKGSITDVLYRMLGKAEASTGRSTSGPGWPSSSYRQSHDAILVGKLGIGPGTAL